MRIRNLLFTLLAVLWCHLAPAGATWQKLTQTASAFHLMPNGIGLIASYDPVFVIQYWDGKSLDGIFAAIDTVTNIIIVDTNVAYASVRRDGLFKATKGWKQWDKVVPGSNVVLVAVVGSRVFYTDGRFLKYYENGAANDVQGIDGTATVIAIDNINSTLVAVADSVIFRSTDNGSTWQRRRSDVLRARSVYADTVHSYFFIGGDTVRRSDDFGLTWTALKASAVAQYDVVEGQVVGSEDCSGLFYVSPVPSRGEILRSDQAGKFFHTVGPANFASISMRKGLTYNNASRFYWLDGSGTFSVSLDGVDGSVRDSAASLVDLKLVNEVRDMICAPQPAPVDLTITTPGCNSFVFDSIKVISASGTFGKLAAMQPIQSHGSLSTTYRAKRAGIDTARLRTWFHSTLTGLRESKDFTIVVEGSADPAALKLETTQLDFGTIKPLESKKLRLVISNTGCDTLRIDSLITTSTIFKVDTVLPFPFKLLAGAKLDIGIVYAPTEVGPSIEALEIGTSAAHQFVKLKGVSSTAGSLSVAAEIARSGFSLYPNPARNSTVMITGKSSVARAVRVFDPLGREVLSAIVDQDIRETQLDLSALEEGLYIVMIEGQPHASKLVIAK